MSLDLSATEAIVTPATSWLSGSGNIYMDVLIITFAIVLVALLVFALVIQRAMRAILQITMPTTVEKEVEETRVKRIKRQEKWKNTWNNILGLHRLEEEKDLLIDHEYDGIVELDNPIPVWFNVLFYSTVVFGFVYLLVYHVFGWGMLQDQEYLHEVAQAEKAKQEYLAQSASLVDESSVEFNEIGRAHV